ncbi:hypothetical protein AMAG_09142 [Allomyces macrogynus ATCC 38327]|uniref:Uncharacterized protein n=1 Tax=Allomyces macrogynus (strain ATCC 38327) TaxID=578462 RepID=A0A0L0SNX4_ALLM3|nr:hypothetical protein AMAG_09142 [Allomyces macrogynus ATCC 38327]|eukprot:KNE64084.1 hypothetical protein AMAG_09142 [Allomyces macrogynus ATCC 38327]
MEIDDTPTEREETPEPAAEPALPEFVLRPLLDTYVAAKNNSDDSANTKEQRSGELFDKMTTKYLKDMAAALNLVKLSGQRFSNVDIVKLHEECHARKRTKELIRKVEKANEALVVSVDQCKTWAATVPVQPLEDGMLGIFLSAVTGLRCDPVFLQTEPHDEFTYLEMRDDKLFIRGNRVMSEKDKNRGKYVIDIEIESPFKEQILANVSERAAAGQTFVFENLVVDGDEKKSRRNYSELVNKTIKKIKELNSATVTDFRKAHTTRETLRYKTGEISFVELTAKFHARGHGTTVADYYYRLQEDQDE